MVNLDDVLFGVDVVFGAEFGEFVGGGGDDKRIDLQRLDVVAKIH